MKRKFFKILLIEIIIVGVVFIYLYKKISIYDSLGQNYISINSDEGGGGLNLDKSDIYLKIEKALLDGEEQIIINDLSLFKEPKEIFLTLENITNENPEVMYYKGAEYQFGKLKLNYSRNKDEICSHREDIRKIRDEFISSNIFSNMTEYEKVLVVHDYIINNTKYDERLDSEGVVPPESYSAYGVLSLGIGVCEGYAKAMKYLLDDAGIESLIVIGESRGENHAWNLVKIDEEYYHIDSTWDDPVSKEGSDVLRYNFLNLNDEDISKTHYWNRECYPKASGIKYNYYNYNNLTVYGKHDLEIKLRNALIKRYSKISFRITNYNNENIDLSEIVESIVYSDYDIIKLTSYTYSLDENYGIVSFEFFYN